MRETTRRQLLAGGLGVAGLVAVGRAEAKKHDEDEVPPTEDLMREHGVLRRVLLIYGEIVRRIGKKEEVPAHELEQAATIVREFIEDYHEKDEEELVFPRLKKAGKLVELVDVLTAQHQAGRRVTVEILRLAHAPGEAAKAQLAAQLSSFIRMYEPHAAREDTVLFPAFRALLSEKELAKLQDVFEDKEKALPQGGFEKRVDDVAKLEQALGIYDLAKFTPA